MSLKNIEKAATAPKEWFSAAELAALPGLPGSERRIRAKAVREQWQPQRKRPGRGGGVEYHVDALPLATRTALWIQKSTGAKAGVVEAATLNLRDELTEKATQARRLDGLKKSISLSHAAQRRADAKLALLRAVEIFQHSESLPLTRALPIFVERYAVGKIDVEPWVRETIGEVSSASLQRWRRTIKRDGVARLAGSYGNRKGASKIDGQTEVRDLVVGLLCDRPHARATHLMQALRARFGERQEVDLPSMRALERWIAQWKKQNAQVFTALANPDAWKSRYMVAFGSQSEGVTQLNQRWELDSTPGDVMLTDGRHQILGVIDVYSRRAKFLVAKTSKATAVAALIRRALLDWGVPKQAKTDNGKDYVSDHVTRVLQALEVEHVLCPPFQPQHKPHIERLFGTFTRDLVELLDGFIGHSVAERKAIEARRSFADRLMQRNEVVEIALSSDEFQNFCDRWCDDIYAHRIHAGLNDKSPVEVAAAWRAPVQRIGDERALDILLAEAPDRGGMRTVQKNGIALDNAWFIAPELEAFVGQTVQVRFDPQDIGRVYVFGGNELAFICIAECPERTGINRQEVASRAREQQKKRVQEQRRILKQTARRAGTNEIVAEILRERAVKARKVVTFPQPRDEYETAALNAAADAIAALDQPLRTTADLMPAAEFSAARAAIEAERQKPTQPVFDTPFQRAYWIAEQALSRALSEEETEYLSRFRREKRASAKDIDELLTARYGREPVHAAKA